MDDITRLQLKVYLFLLKHVNRGIVFEVCSSLLPVSLMQLFQAIVNQTANDYLTFWASCHILVLSIGNN